MTDRGHLRLVHTEEELLTRAELAALLHVSDDVIDRMRKKGMPEIAWGARLVRFRPSAVMAWLEQQEAA